MAILDLPEGTRVASGTLGAISPGQSRLEYIYSGAVDVISRGPTMWTGTVSIHTAQGKEKKFLAFAQAQNGQAGVFRFHLGPQRYYAPENHKDNAGDLKDYTVSAVSNNDVVTIAPTNSTGTVNWSPSVGDLVNVGNRLTIVRQVVNDLAVKLSPLVAKANDVVKVSRPFVVARLDAQSQWTIGVAREGNLIQSVGWIEAVGITR